LGFYFFAVFDCSVNRTTKTFIARKNRVTVTLAVTVNTLIPTQSRGPLYTIR